MRTLKVTINSCPRCGGSMMESEEMLCVNCGYHDWGPEEIRSLPKDGFHIVKKGRPRGSKDKRRRRRGLDVDETLGA